MAQKHLHELLREDQEPFVLKNYIADKCGQFQKSSPRNQIQVKKRKPVSQTSNFPVNFCKNACFFSFHDSPDPKKSPLFEFSSPAAKSSCRSHHQNAIFLNIPARTAAILVEAAVRIQKQSTKSKNQSKNNGLFGFFLKRLSKKNKNREISGDGAKTPVILPGPGSKASQRSRKSISTSPVKEKTALEINAYETGFSCSGRPSSSAVWSESNEEKSLDLDLLYTSSSSQSEDFDELKNEKCFCKSPFHFVLQRSPSSGHQTPVFSSPATFPSPNRRKKQDYDNESTTKLQVEEEEKEQCSPVSVLDPPFEDEQVEDEDDDDEEEEDRDHGYDLECSYANVERAKHQLLQKLRRFEKLAELDPIELEKRIAEHEDDDNSYDGNSEDCFEHESTASSDIETDVDELVKEVLISSFRNKRRIPEGMKRLVSDLIAEEEAENSGLDREGIAKRVCQRLESSWREVESNTIDMMVGMDLRNSEHVNVWKRSKYPEEIREIAVEVEYAIFGLLVEEVSEELVLRFS